MNPYSPCHANPEPSGNTNNFQCRLVILHVDRLCPHPSYTRHELSVSAPQLSALSELGDMAFQQPIMVTQTGIVIDGYARLELARRQCRQSILCLEYDFSLEEALGALIRAHHPSRGLTDFVRIQLALDLEPYFQKKALMNQQTGGQGKALSKLTKAQRVDTRREVARLAGVSSGNVWKVKHILAQACVSLLQAARTEEVSINLADKWNHEPPAEQQEYLRLFRIERGIQKKARNLVMAHLARISPPTRDRQVMQLSNFVGILNHFATSNEEQFMEIGSVEVEVVDAPGRTIFITQELIHFLTPRKGVLV